MREDQYENRKDDQCDRAYDRIHYDVLPPVTYVRQLAVMDSISSQPTYAVPSLQDRLLQRFPIAWANLW